MARVVYSSFSDNYLPQFQARGKSLSSKGTMWTMICWTIGAWNVALKATRRPISQVLNAIPCARNWGISDRPRRPFGTCNSQKWRRCLYLLTHWAWLWCFEKLWESSAVAVKTMTILWGTKSQQLHAGHPICFKNMLQLLYPIIMFSKV